MQSESRGEEANWEEENFECRISNEEFRKDEGCASSFLILHSKFEIQPSNKKGFPSGNPNFQREQDLLRDAVTGLVRSDPYCHLIFEVQLALLQRLLFHFFFDGHLSLGGELAEA
jgi:hypothetical protein